MQQCKKEEASLNGGLGLSIPAIDVAPEEEKAEYLFMRHIWISLAQGAQLFVKATQGSVTQIFP